MRADARRERDGRQTGRLCLANAVERDRHAPFRGDNIGTPLQQLGWKSRRDPARDTRQLWRRRRCGRGVAAEQELERSNRLLTGQLELTEHVAIGSDAGARDEHVLLTADPDPHPVTGQPHELLARTDGLACRLDLQSSLGGEEPALGHDRRNRLSRVLEIRLRRCGLRGARRPAIAHPSPEVELPGRGEADTRKT